MSLQINVLPYINESFISWFIRTAFENGTDPKSFAISIWKQDSLLYRDLDRFLPDDLAIKLSELSSLSYEKIKNLTLEPLINKVDTSISENIHKKSYLINPFGQKGKVRTNGIHFCPDCLKNQETYINKNWRFSWFIICPIHKKLLLLNCENCNYVFSPEKLNYLSPHIYLCAKCGYDLRISKTRKSTDRVLNLQNLLYKAISQQKVSKNFPLVTKNNIKDLFLTLYIFLAFLLKILRQPIRFKNLIQALNLETNHKFEKLNNGTFSRLDIKDKEQLLICLEKVFRLDFHTITNILIQQKISRNILNQTFKNISPTIEYILSKLSNKKLTRFQPKRIKKHIFPQTTVEVEKLFEDILPYIPK